MLKMLPPLLLLAAATNASAATYDPCIAAGDQTMTIAQARDDGVLMSKFLTDAAGKFETDAEQEQYFRRVVQIYIFLPESADKLKESAIDRCNAAGGV